MEVSVKVVSRSLPVLKALTGEEAVGLGSAGSDRRDFRMGRTGECRARARGRPRGGARRAGRRWTLIALELSSVAPVSVAEVYPATRGALCGDMNP